MFDADAIREMTAGMVSPVRLEEPQPGLYLAFVREGWQQETIDVRREQPAPARQTGKVRFADVAAWVRYVNFYGDENGGTLVLLDPNDWKVTAYLNWHAPGRELEEGEHDPSHTGWGDHVAELMWSGTPEYVAWARALDGNHNQHDLVEFLEDWEHTIAEPDAATLRETVRTLQITADVEWRDIRDQHDGSVDLVARETITAIGRNSVGLPRELTVEFAPFEGAPESLVRLRVRIGFRRQPGGGMTFTLRSAALLQRAVRAYMDQMVQDLNEELTHAQMATGRVVEMPKP